MLKFLSSVPTLLINNILAAGDLHIGIEEKLSKSGINVSMTAERLATRLLSAYALSNPRMLVLLGDIKDAIGYPDKQTYSSLQRFFYLTRSLQIKIAKGNHDGHLAEILHRLNYEIGISREVIIGNIAFLHGNALPSKRAVLCDYLIEAHGHLALDVSGSLRKVFVVAHIGKGMHRRYAVFNKKIKLVLVPPLNPLILGNALNEDTRKHIPAFRSELFDFYSAKIYADKELGSVSDFLQ